MIRCLILGAGGLAEDAAGFIRSNPETELCGFIDGLDDTCTGRRIDGLPVHWIGDVADWSDRFKIITAIGSSDREMSIDLMKKYGFSFLSVVHEKSHVADRQDIGTDVVIAPGVTLAAKVVISSHVYINRNSSVGHHTTIGSFTTIGPGVNIGGNCKIGKNVQIGIGATIIDNVTIGDGASVSAGALVMLAVPAGHNVFQMPSRPRPRRKRPEVSE